MPKVKKDKEAMQKRGDILLDLRKKRNIKQSTVADILGISQQAYLKYEHGEADPTIDALIVLSDFYNVSIEYLLGLEKIKEPDVLTRLVQEFNLTEIEKVIVQAYIAISPKEREKFVRAIEEAVRQPDAENNSPIQQTTNQKEDDGDEYITYTTTIGAEMDRRKALEAVQRAVELDDAETKKKKTSANNYDNTHQEK